MRILYLCPDAGIPVLGRKGASVHVRELIAALSRAGHQVVLATPLLNKSVWEKPEEIAATVLHLRLSSSAQSAVLAAKAFDEMLGTESSLPSDLRRILYNQELPAELQRRFDNDPPDFIYERASLFGTTGTTLAQVLNVPLLVELNAPLAVEQAAYRGTGLGELASKAELWTLRQADAVFTVSASLREHVIALGVEPSKVQVLPNGVDPARFQPGQTDPGVHARLGLDTGPVLGFVGGLRPWHGVEFLPPLLDRLAKRHVSLRLVVAGDGQLRPELQRDFCDRGLADRVVFAGAIPHEEVPAVIRQFDVALAPYPNLSHDFYFSPLKIFEYMACGIPVVAAQCGQISDVVQDGRTGLLYPPGDLDALTAACDRLLSDAVLRAALGQAAANLVRSHYTWDHNAQRIGELAQRLVASKKQG
jgi:glycosyltransferase involved in cell wall biosynthesis